MSLSDVGHGVGCHPTGMSNMGREVGCHVGHGVGPANVHDISL